MTGASELNCPDRTWFGSNDCKLILGLSIGYHNFLEVFKSTDKLVLQVLASLKWL